jgi:hypothetical protein
MKERMGNCRIVIVDLYDEQLTPMFNSLESDDGLLSKIREIFEMMKGTEDGFGMKIPKFQMLWRKALLSAIEASVESEKIENEDLKRASNPKGKMDIDGKSMEDIQKECDNAFDEMVETIDLMLESLLF